MQTTRGVGSLATHPIAAKHFEEVGAASILCFYGSVCRHPRAVEPVLSLALGPATEPPAPEPVLIHEQEKPAMREDAGWCPDGHVRRKQRKTLGGGPHIVWATGNA